MLWEESHVLDALGDAVNTIWNGTHKTARSAEQLSYSCSMNHCKSTMEKQ